MGEDWAHAHAYSDAVAIASGAAHEFAGVGALIDTGVVLGVDVDCA